MCSKLVDFACKIWNTATAIQDGKADHSGMSRGKEKVQKGGKGVKQEDSTASDFSQFQ